MKEWTIGSRICCPFSRSFGFPNYFVSAPFETDVTFKQVEAKNTEAAGDFLKTRVICGDSEVTGMIFNDALAGLRDYVAEGVTLHVVAHQNRNKTLTIHSLADAA